MRTLKIALIAAGVIGLLGAVLITPEFIADHISSDNIISPEGYKSIDKLRAFSAVLGGIFLLYGLLSLRFPVITGNFLRSLTGTVSVLIFVWIVVAFINFLLQVSAMGPGTPAFFPFSEFYGPWIRVSGLPYSLLFLSVLFLFLRKGADFNLSYVWIIGTLLIVFGNLAQGGPEEAFYKPIVAPDYFYDGVYYYEQYYHEAINITDWRQWTANYNSNQLDLKIHARTHPPFAVLLHYLFIKISNNSLPVMSALFILLSGFSIVLVFQIMKELGSSRRQCSMISVLFSLIPAYNIYSAICLDGVIVTFSALFLLGMIVIIKRGLVFSGVVMFTAGLLLVNLHTFLGLFLLGSAGMVVVHQMLFHKKFELFKTLIICLSVMTVVYFGLVNYYGYSHLAAFITGAGFEPSGVLFAYPVKYVMTRLENIMMYAIFLSLGILASLFHSTKLGVSVLDWKDDINAVFIAGLVPLIPFLLMGGLYTGEIARICLFIYPFFIIVLRKSPENLLRFLLISTGVQTFIMQTFGGYFW